MDGIHIEWQYRDFAMAYGQLAVMPFSLRYVIGHILVMNCLVVHLELILCLHDFYLVI